MKKKNKKNNKDNNKLLMTIFAVALIIAIIGGSTFAYWSWTTNTSQQTVINAIVPPGDDFTFTITGGTVTSTGTMYPTNDCDGSGALVSGEATVVAENPTESEMKVYLAIRATLSAKQGTLNTTNKGKLNWAIVDTSTSATCASPTASGTLASASTNTDIDTGITFTVSGLTTTTKKYKMYIWLDSTYTFTNTGSTISDPMQNLTINVQWSPDSRMVMSQDTTFTFSP